MYSLNVSSKICCLFCFGLITSLFVTAVSVSAEDPLRGRLPDGRAFRTDAQGIQIVDYIAELELTVEDLNRKVHGLEYQLDQKRMAASGQVTGQRLQERDILSNSRSQSQRSASVRKQPVVASDCQSTAGSNRDTARLNQLESQLASERREVASLQKMVDRCNVTKASSRDQARAMQNQQNQLSQKLSSLQGQGKECSQKYTQCSSQVSLLQAELQSAKTAEQRALQDQKVMQADIARLNASLQKTQSDLQQASATMQAKSAEAQSARGTDYSRASYSPERMRALEAAKGTIKSEINKVNSLARSRDKKFQIYLRTSKNASVRVSPSKLVSRRNYTLSMVRKRLKNASSRKALSALRRDVSDIEGVVRDDLATLNRMSARGRG
jgi:chromosome segregation ATPase